MCFFTWSLYNFWTHRRIVINKLHVKQKNISTTEVELVGTPFRHMPLDEIYKDGKNIEHSFELYDNQQVSMIDTPGCQIPVSMVDYENYFNITKEKATCGRRAVFLTKTSVQSNNIRVMIKSYLMKRYLKAPNDVYVCCYRFIKSVGNGVIRYSRCTETRNGGKFSLDADFVNIKCLEYDNRNVTHEIYNDVFAFVKKQNKTWQNKGNCKQKYNVLMIGMDSMSLPRFSKSMPRTVNFFKENFWLAYRGYHKIGDNTFPNLMAVLSGYNVSTIYKKCKGNMDQCNDLLIWSMFKNSGFITAYGEDYIRLPDTFHKSYAFHMPPTDHYMRPFFQRSETELNNKSLVCAGKVSSAQQVLTHALDFASSYRTEAFFGLYWINSFSHNINSHPQNADKLLENFFNQLAYTGILSNTFIILFSDHGLRFGQHRLKVESYYDDRLPFLFISPPYRFKEKYYFEFKSAANNQFRLVTPYDLYSTLVDINRMSTCANRSGSFAAGCHNCHSIFRPMSINRTCQDVAIHDKWCSCHTLYPLDTEDLVGMQSVTVVISQIKSQIRTVKTNKCWVCMEQYLSKIIRIHYYYDKHKANLYHVVALTMTPGNVSYEATVLRGHQTEMVGPVSIISPYRGRGQCAIEAKERIFCVCQKIKNCVQT